VRLRFPGILLITASKIDPVLFETLEARDVSLFRVV
jgi:hypothetical protein